MLKSRWSRALSLLLATPLALVLLLHPASMLNADGSYSHGLLMLVMLGISSGFIHGLGFDPLALIWRLVFHPLLGWLLMALGYGIIFRTQLLLG
nr:cyd operon YbgE family protein [Azomonas macrocytogenes]